MAAKPIFVQAVDTNGTPYSGAKLNVYDAGTTTPRAIYTESGLGTASANPAIADANGVVVVWVNDAGGDIKVTLTNSAETVTPHNEDNVPIASLTCYPVITFQGDQSLLTTSSPTFAGLTLGNISFAGVTTDPNADRGMFWDDSAGQVAFFDLGTGLAFNGTTLELDGDLQDISGLTPTDGGVIIGDGTDFVVESGATLRTSIGVAIGSDVLAYDANLQAFVSVFTAPTVDGVNGQYLKTDGAGNLAFATPSGGGDLLASLNLSDLDNAATARTNLGVAIGADVQAYDAGLASIASLTTAADKGIYTTASDTYSTFDLSSFARTVLGDATAKAARTTLEVNTKYVATISALKALTGGDFDLVEVGGHTSANDGGGGRFVWDASDTTTDDNGVYIQPNAGGAGRWIRQYKPGELNIDWFGASGDGATDDSAVIESVVSAMSAGEVLSFSPGKVYHCDSKIDVTSKLGISFTTGSSRNNDGAVNARVVLDAASADDTLFNFSETSGILFKNITLEGPGRTVSGSHVVKVTDGSGDIDFYFEGCTVMSAETLVRMEGRNIHFVPGCALVDFNTVLEIDWPTSYSTGSNDDQTNENGMRGYVIDGCRIHAGSGGFMVKNSGANAHFIKGIQITNNYIDTSTRMFTGHARELLFANNININNGANASALFEVQDDLNTVGGVVNYDVSILNNVFSGMSDSVTTDRSMLGIATIYNTSGIKIIGNLFSRVDRNVLTLIDVTDFNISGNTYRDCQLDNIVPAANGALRRDIIFASGASSRGYIGNETVSTSHTPDSVQPIVETSSATVTELVIGPISFDAAKWSRTDYAESDSAFNDFTVGGDLTVTGDVIQDLSFVQGKKVILDTDGDTYIRCAADDDLRFGIGGTEPLQVNANGVGFGPAGISFPGDFGGTGASAFRSYTNAQSQTAHVFGAQNSTGTLVSMGLIYCSPSDYTSGSEDSRFRIEHRVAGALVNKELCVSAGGTGGAGSAGSGNQYVEIEINGTTYKVLHDGTV